MGALGVGRVISVSIHASLSLTPSPVSVHPPHTHTQSHPLLPGWENPPLQVTSPFGSHFPPLGARGSGGGVGQCQAAAPLPPPRGRTHQAVARQGAPAAGRSPLSSTATAMASRLLPALAFWVGCLPCLAVRGMWGPLGKAWWRKPDIGGQYLALLLPWAVLGQEGAVMSAAYSLVGRGSQPLYTRES